MELVWVVPVVVLSVGAVGIVALLRESAGAARQLASEVARFGELHVVLARVRAELVRGAATSRDLRNR